MKNINNILFGLIGTFAFFAFTGWLIDFTGWQVYLLGAVAGGLSGAICQWLVNKVQLKLGVGHEDSQEYLWSFLGGFFLSPIASTLFVFGVAWWWFIIAAILVFVANYVLWKK